MRRPTGYADLTRLKTFLAHSGQTAVLGVVAVMAMAAAPSATRSSVAAETPDAVSAPVAPPIRAMVEKPLPVTRTIAFSTPVKGHAINSPFGLRKLAIEAKARAHKGVDIAAPMGTSVFSTSEGRVLRTGYDAGGYGKFIEVRHPNGLTSLYGHLSRVDVTQGDAVAAVTNEFPASIRPTRMRAEPDDGVAPASAAGPTSSTRVSSAASASKTAGWPGVCP